ncbi:MAG: thiamine diphosphokinase [Lachnospiraceae bacterium]
MRILIITGGTIEDDFALEFIKKHHYEYTIAVDRGMEFFYRTGQTPDCIVGDFDSANPEILAWFQSQPNIRILHFEPEKDETDTELAIRTAIKEGGQELHLLGASGTRMDHVLGNIQLLGMAMEAGVSCFMIDAYNRVRLLKENYTISKNQQFGDYVSLLPFTPRVTGLTLKGFKYPLFQYELECFHSLGVSNEIQEEEGEISFESGILIMVESRDKKIDSK